MKALVVGGTGPTGPHILTGLISRGYDVTVFHRGTHEPDDLPVVRHVHGDPHFRETIDEGLGSAEFDVVVAAYGRVKLIAEMLRDRCQQFFSISGTPVYAGWFEPQLHLPFGLPNPVAETADLVNGDIDTPLPSLRFAAKMVRTERAILAAVPHASIFRYPMIYGPRNPIPWEWAVIKRVLDGRPRMILPDGGMSIHQRCAARNAAEYLLLAIDAPDRSAGQIYNVGDEVLWTTRQWVELIAQRLGARLDIVGIPADIALETTAALKPQASELAPHSIYALEKARTELGYRDVVDPTTALFELVDWDVANPPDVSTLPGFLERFDYEREDRLITVYESAREAILRDVPQEPGAPMHAMPHPSAPGAVDQRGR
jgi:nucleoside-diphosphate-sugar epimerase